MKYQVFTIEYDSGSLYQSIYHVKSFTDMNEAKKFAKELADSHAKVWIESNKHWIKEYYNREADFEDVFKQIGTDDDIISFTTNWGFTPLDDDYPEIRVVKIE